MTWRRLLFALSTLLVSGAALATVTTDVDRTNVELNESFTLEITTDADADLQPDVSVLDKDFYVGQGSQLSNTTIINNQMQHSMTWTYVLMPKHAGTLTIPPITLGKEQSKPIVVTVKEPEYAPPGEADVFVTSDVDDSDTYVQAQVLLTVKIYRAVATRQPSLRDPEISGAETLVELAGDDKSYESVINGTAYNVIERVYALYPQESGEIQISPARFEARVLRDGRITGRKVFQSDAKTVTVKPIPPPPPGYPNATWLPARELELSEDWSSDPATITAGEPVTRHVTTSVLGQLETQIPAIDPPTAAGLHIYPDKPELTRRSEAHGIRGIRKDQYAIIGTAPGTAVLPALELPWWNVGEGKWEVARLPERTLRILPAAGSETPTQAAAPAAAPTAGSDETEAAPTPASPTLANNLWQRISEGLAVLWLVTVVYFWWVYRRPGPPQVPREPAPTPPHRQQARHLKIARKAALEGDAATVRQALLDWAKLEWPDAAPRSVGALAGRVSEPLAEELRRLSRLSYGPQRQAWDGTAMAKALRSISTTTAAAQVDDDPLPPLMPSS
ncbi:MAG: BatD family protein [Woeseiaceae bacterium]